MLFIPVDLEGLLCNACGVCYHSVASEARHYGGVFASR